MRRLETSALSMAVLVVLAAFAGNAAAGTAAARDARITGDVLVCNGPNRCFARRFEVTAYDANGEPVASAPTRSPHNTYRLRVPAGQYQLVAVSSGLTCQASTVAVAHHTTHQDITCAVP